MGPRVPVAGRERSIPIGSVRRHHEGRGSTHVPPRKESLVRYMLLIYGPEQDAGSGVDPMPDMAPWNAYTRWLVDQGIFRGGDPLAPTTAATTVRVREGQRLMTDGPFAETKEVLGGYYIVECDDLDTALEAAARCPGALYGSLEVRPLAEMPDAPTSG
jgi:hypothetical protein